LVVGRVGAPGGFPHLWKTLVLLDALEEGAVASGRFGGGPDAERPRALGAFGERRRDDRQRGGRDERGTEALQCARADEHALARGKAVEQR
jgi:hypothetical protein